MTILPMNEKSLAPIYVVSGPSGSGKTSLCARALEDLPWIRPSVSHTTRTPRTGEIHGKDYFFVDRPAFKTMIETGAFLEWAEVHGQFYGTSVRNRNNDQSDTSLLYEVDCRGARQIREKLPGAVLIFIMTPSFDDLISRIHNRGRMTPEELAIRVRTARDEIRQADAFDYLIINDRFPEASAQFQSILTTQRCTRAWTLPSWSEKWASEILRHSGPTKP